MANPIFLPDWTDSLTLKFRKLARQGATLDEGKAAYCEATGIAGVSDDQFRNHCKKVTISWPSRVRSAHAGTSSLSLAHKKSPASLERGRLLRQQKRRASLAVQAGE